MSLFPLLSHMKEKKKITDNSTKFWLNLERSVQTITYINSLEAEEISKLGNFYVHISSHD